MFPMEILGETIENSQPMRESTSVMAEPSPKKEKKKKSKKS
ncbi:hypothetical protein A2U01_0082034, partial [Trifolium medium]|nr:hypothetical protein [Trifolium medium]